MRCVVLAVSLIAGLARADDAPPLDAVTSEVPSCTRLRCFGIRLHGEAKDWFALQLATANHHFASIDVGFELVEIEPLSVPVLHTRKDRDALAKHSTGPVIDVFITEQLDDVDALGEVRQGVTWRTKQRKYVILSATARERVLAHELGHFFGLPHSTYAISIMNKTERTEPPVEQRTFAPEEIIVMKARLKQLLRDKVIVDVRKP